MNRIAAHILFMGCALLATVGGEAAEFYALDLIDGTFYGPGVLPDAPMPRGKLGHISFDRPLGGKTEFFNNGPAPPNIENEGVLKKTVDGRTSNGIEFNEYLDGGIVDVGRGAMKYLSVVVNSGRRGGRQFYELDKAYDWRIESDVALDPGFPEGVAVAQNLVITTGLVWVPQSLQSQQGIPGGIDRTGSLPAGTPLIGRLGDYDRDGFLDGTVVGIANIPLGNIFLPGSSVSQFRRFVSDIPISRYDAALLTTASIHNFEEVWRAYVSAGARDTAKMIASSGVMTGLLKEVADRLDAAAQLLMDADDRPERRLTAQTARAKLLAARRMLDGIGVSISDFPNSASLPAKRQKAVMAIFDEARKVTDGLARHADFSGR